MGLETVIYPDDLVITNPLAGDLRSEGDDHLRNIKVAIRNAFPGLAGRAWRVQTKSSGYTPIATDNMSLLSCTAALTLAFTAAATLGSGYMFLVHANGGDVTLDPNGAETINGAATLVVANGCLAIVVCNGASFIAAHTFVDLATYRATYEFTTGDVKLTLKTVADAGWVLMNDGTIGNATSGGTTRANADTVDLFTLLWNNTANADCAVSSGRGANAAADYAASKTIALPKALGRALAGAGAGSGLTSRALAKIVGEEAHVQVIGELAAHNHGGVTGTDSVDHSHGYTKTTVTPSTIVASDGPNGYPTEGGASTGGASAFHTHSIPSQGSSTAANVMQPSLFLTVAIKL